MPIRAIILLSVFIASLPVCLFRPYFGILMWTIVAFLNPQSFLWGYAAWFPWALAVAIPTLIGLPIFCPGWTRRLLSAEVFMIVILWVWFTVTSFVSAGTPIFAHHADDTWFRWGFVSKILLMTLVTIVVVDSFARLRLFVIVMAGCFGFYVLKSLPFIVLTRGAFRIYGPDNSMISDNNDFGLALTMTLPLFFFLMRTETGRWAKRLFGLLCLITIPAIFFTYSRGALLGLTVVLFLMFLRIKQRIILLPFIVLGLAVAVAFAPDAWKVRMDPTGADVVDASARSRFNAWTFSYRLASDFPLMGGGFATFTPELFARYAPSAVDVHGPHSIYFGVLAEHGFVGLFLYLILLLRAFLSLRQLVRTGRLIGDQKLIDYGEMLLFSLVGFLTSGTFLGRAYFDYFFAILACVVILKRVSSADWTRLAAGEDFQEEAA